MMKDLLENDFVSHYRLSKNGSINVVSTSSTDFDLEDDPVLIYPSGEGTAKYSNPSNKEVNIIRYELFFKSLPQLFQKDKLNCDLFVYTFDGQYFLLNELTDKNKKKGKKRKHAISQMFTTLQLISAVSTINAFINQHVIKQCCYFNKKYQSPRDIRAISAFNRINSYSQNGYKMSDSDIESYGFELWEFSGNQTFVLRKLRDEINY